MNRIEIRIEWCAGHRLMDHDGKCRHIHGHNYLATIHVEGPIRSGEADPQRGMVADFGPIKAEIKAWIDRHWDHAFVADQRDLQIIEALRLMGEERIFLLPHPPTAERMAEFLLLNVCRDLKTLTGTAARVVEVWVSETPNCAACAALED